LIDQYEDGGGGNREVDLKQVWRIPDYVSILHFDRTNLCTSGDKNSGMNMEMSPLRKQKLSKKDQISKPCKTWCKGSGRGGGLRVGVKNGVWGCMEGGPVFFWGVGLCKEY